MCSAFSLITRLFETVANEASGTFAPGALRAWPRLGAAGLGAALTHGHQSTGTHFPGSRPGGSGGWGHWVYPGEALGSPCSASGNVSDQTAVPGSLRSDGGRPGDSRVFTPGAYLSIQADKSPPSGSPWPLGLSWHPTRYQLAFSVSAEQGGSLQQTQRGPASVLCPEGSRLRPDPSLLLPPADQTKREPCSVQDPTAGTTLLQGQEARGVGAGAGGR